MKLGRLHHVGAVVPSLATARRFHVETMGGELRGAAIDVDGGIARIGFVQMPGVLMEFIEPLAPDTDLAAFLASHPGGAPHHLCHEVDDIAAASAEAAAAGAEFICPIVTGVLGLPIFFVRFPAVSSLLLELIQIRTA